MSDCVPSKDNRLRRAPSKHSNSCRVASNLNMKIDFLNVMCEKRETKNQVMKFKIKPFG